jgi:hypothetical protein
MQQQTRALSDALDVTLPQGDLAEPQPFYRLELVERPNGSIELVHLSLAIVERFPQAAFAADYMLVSHDAAGAVRDVVPVLFERKGHSSSFELGAFVHEEFALESAVTTAFLPAPPGLSNIEVLDVDMNVELSIDAGSLPSSEEPDDEPSDDPGLKATGTSLKTLFPSLRVLKPGEESQLPAEMLTSAKIVPMTSAVSRQIADGLASATEIMSAAVRTLAAVEWPAGSSEHRDPPPRPRRGAVFGLGRRATLGAERERTRHSASHDGT